MKRIAVTGATSMLGVALINECIKNNIEVLAIIRPNSEKIKRLPQSDLLTICECDLDQYNTIMSEKKYDVFFHFAWGYTSKITRDDAVLQQKNIQYTLDAVELAKRLGCTKFIGAGSQAEYGIVNQMITEETKENPITCYGIAKNAAGRLSRKLCEKYEITHIWGRVFSVYGINDSTETLISYAVEKFRNRETAYFSAATQYWDYLNEEDAGKIFYLIGEKIDECKTYRIASGNSKPLKEYIIEMRDLFSKNLECKFDIVSNTNNVVNLQVDVSDLMSDIDFAPQIMFKDGIKKIIRYSEKSNI